MAKCKRIDRCECGGKRVICIQPGESVIAVCPYYKKLKIGEDKIEVKQ